MGNGLSTISTQLDLYLHDLPGIVYESTLGNARFMKTLQCIHDEGTVIVKVYLKREDGESLKEQDEKLQEIRVNFSNVEHPNILSFQRWLETDKSAYLIRQYIIHNLYDRISTRPFLTQIEKKWIVYQLLKALTQCHFYGICHGDIKCENILVTSWNWVYITDFASYKPTYIPLDNPAVYSYFFDSSGRRTCYIAPERLKGMPEDTKINQEMQPAMDIFSVGCVIAELFLDGSPLFTLSDMIAYIKGDFNPDAVINRISDTSMQELIRHMICKDPKKRSSAEKYIERWTTEFNAFPPYFSYLHNYVSTMMSKDPDDKVHLVQRDFNSLLQKFTSTDLPASFAFKSAPLKKSFEEQEENSPPKELPVDKDVDQDDPAFGLMMETEEFIHRLITSKEEKEEETPSTHKKSVELRASREEESQKIGAQLFDQRTKPSPIINADTYAQHPSSTSTVSSENFVAPSGSEGFVIILNVICSFANTIRFPSSKLIMLDLFSQLSKYLDSEIRLQRIVPYVISLLNEASPLVRATALKVLTEVLAKVENFPPSDSHVFPAYILPAVSKFSNEESEPEDMVREAFAECLASLAETSKKFLELSQFFKHNTEASGEKDLVSHQESYDAELTEIQDAFYEIVAEMLTKDSSTAVRRTLLTDITRLCIFFGNQKTNNFLLPFIISFLNVRHDWELRCAFFNNIVGVSAFVGMDSLEHYILPCILQALTDEEEFVIDKAVNSLASLCELGLFRKHKLFDIADKTAPMLYYPNMWIRFGVVAIMAKIALNLKLADIHCFLIPCLKPFLTTDIIEINEETLLEALKPPVSRESFNKAMLIAFDILESGTTGSLSVSLSRISTTSVRDVISITPTDDHTMDSFDVAFLEKLGQSGINKGEEENLFAMKNFIKSASRAIYSKGKQSSFLEEEDVGSKFSQLSKLIPVQSTPVPSLDKNVQRFSQRIASPLVPPVKQQSTPVLTRVVDVNKINKPPIVQEPVKGFPMKYPAHLFPPPPPDLGVFVPTKSTTEPLKDWQPKGVLVAHLHEHKAAVNRLEICRDNLFFVSASDDGTVKIWDCQRLEKNVTNRSRLTYSAQGGKIKVVTLCETSHSIASGSDNGSVHIFRVEYAKKETEKNPKYTGMASIRNIEAEGSVVEIDHYNHLHQSLLAYGTVKCKVHGLDLRSKNEAWLLNNPLNLGLLSSFLVEPGRNWLITGTHSGYYTCWDLRFHVPVKTWRDPSKRIHRLHHYTPVPDNIIHSTNVGSSTSGSWFFSTSGIKGEVTAWDVQTGLCKEVFRLPSTEIADAPKPLPARESVDFGVEELEAPSKSPQTNGIKAILNPPDCPFLITAGDDKKIRFWNLQNAANSYIICGQRDDQPKPEYRSRVRDSAVVYQEITGDQQDHATANKPRGPTLTPTNHHATILDVKAMELPHRMLLSCSRDGVIKVWK